MASVCCACIATLNVAFANSICPLALPGNVNAAATRDGRDFALFGVGLPGSKSMQSHVATHLERLDINSDGVINEIDGVIATRYLIGFRGAPLVAGLAQSGARTSATAVQEYLDAGCIVDLAGQSSWQEIRFSEMPLTDASGTLRNPERGYYRFPSASFLSLTDSQFQNLRQNNPSFSLLVAIIRLDDYRDQRLPQSVLDAIATHFGKARTNGFKLILRFAYNYSETGLDAPLSRVLEHIEQLGPVVRANADVIYVWQAGFIGKWGEMHSSSNGLTTPENLAIIRDALLNQLPENRFLQWRYPFHMMPWDPALTIEADAFSNTRRGRIGVYNDCFLARADDVGTYQEGKNGTTIAQQREWAAARTAITPFGGETCSTTTPEQYRKSCADIRRDGAEYHLSYLNRDFYNVFHNQWTAEGCYAEVENRFGYRWVLERLRAPAQLRPGRPVQMAVTIKNVGWSRLLNARPVQLLLIHRTSATAPIAIDSRWDGRGLKPQETANVLFAGSLPSNAVAGEYDVYFSSPDASPSLAANSAYSLRVANLDSSVTQRWDPARGAFRTGMTVNVSP